MIKVKLTTSSPNWPIIRQTPNSSGIWKDCKFYINQDVSECDYWVVYDNLNKKEKTICPPENTILITGEPSDAKTYSQKFINQFGAIITSQKNIKHPNVLLSQQALPWMIGGKFIKETKSWKKDFSKDYDELTSTPIQNKTKSISVICSSKSHTEGHKQRLLFTDILKEHFKDNIGTFGQGLNPFEDKWDVIAPYKYHIVIENGSHKDYWTEKLSDCFLAGAFPIYHGCTNIYDYFDKKSLAVIDINNPENAIKHIETIINKNTYEESIDELKRARDQVLNKYNLFPMMYDFIKNNSTRNKVDTVTLKPEKSSNLPKKIYSEMFKLISK